MVKPYKTIWTAVCLGGSKALPPSPCWGTSSVSGLHHVEWERERERERERDEGEKNMFQDVSLVGWSLPKPCQAARPGWGHELLRDSRPGAQLSRPIVWLCWPMLAYVGLSCGQCGPILWLCWPMLASCWPMLGQKIRKMGTAKKTL